MEGFELLEEAIRTVPVPGAPPRLSLDGAAVGLSFLDTSLRLNHVRRLTERIAITGHRVARRTAEVDINLGMLDEGQRHAAKMFQDLASHGHPVTAKDGPASLWVPVARIPRATAAPVDVKDEGGRKLPRLTQFETSRLLASGLYRLFRGILTSFPDARQGGELGKLLYHDHRQRWLIQAALLALLTDRNQPGPRAASEDARPPAGTDGDIRRKLIGLLTKPRYGEQLQDYFALLHIALNEQLLVVSLDATTNDHLLTYDSPLRVDPPKRSRFFLPGALHTNGRGYLVHYHGAIPANLRSYHLVVETEPAVHIEHMYLTTNADRTLTTELTDDLRTLAQHLRQEDLFARERSATGIVELKLQSTLRLLGDLLRRRRWDADNAGLRLDGAKLAAADAMGRIAGSGADLPTGNLGSTAGKLDRAAEEIEEQELFDDLSMENDPIGNQANAYWRRRPTRSLAGAQIETRAGMVLRDATPTGHTSIFWYALSVAIIAYGVAAFAALDVWPYWGDTPRPLADLPQAGPLIAVLLLIPGFLYTRLPLPDRHSVAGQLRRLPRLAAYTCIVAMAALSAAVAAKAPAGWLAGIALGASVFPLLAAGVVTAPVVTTWWRRSGRGKQFKSHDLRRTQAPRWTNGRRNKPPAPDVEFHSSERQP
ncbi:hypothetical protein [Amycolatopsis magusensis]|uniref:Uncharacterized protein n=1 Tax=Amycolatopsis magusensis TaxID=882444 RepID=A0ABS4PUF8_9PSEU|nr:hypothetical protein [Amycolatopsis magusensis]MBP2183063.1 hypothetical protein [Amycolatopsis magusensis]